MVTTFYLVRHAEAEGNVKEFFQGNINTDVTPKGQTQLDCLAERFHDIHLDAVYTSPYLRALKTAQAVNRYHNLPLIQNDDLREINGGEWEGRKWADIPRLFPEEHKLWTDQLWLFHAPNGDTMTAVYQRILKVMAEIAEENKGKTVAVVSHGCTLRNFLSFLESGCIEGLQAVGWSDNTAVSLAEYDHETQKWSLIFKNDSSHLSAELSTLNSSAWNRYEKEKT